MIYYRLGASNYFEKTERIYKQSDFESACKNILTKAEEEEENRINIELFQKTLNEKNNQIDELNKKLSEEKETNNIYQKHLETSINNQDKLIKFNPNQTSIIDYLINSVFHCFRV